MAEAGSMKGKSCGKSYHSSDEQSEKTAEKITKEHKRFNDTTIKAIPD